MINTRAQKLFEEMATIKRAMEGARGHLLSELNLTRTQLEILFIFAKNPRQTIGELADAMGVTNGAATQMIEVMVRRNLLNRVPDTHDRRVTHVVMTESGKTLTHELRNRHGALMAKVLKGINPDEIENLIQQLFRVRNQIDFNQKEI